jgi:hypothetical protein
MKRIELRDLVLTTVTIRYAGLTVTRIRIIFTSFEHLVTEFGTTCDKFRCTSETALDVKPYVVACNIMTSQRQCRPNRREGVSSP